MTTKFDLHCHSTASDGALIPEQLVHRAATQGVTSLALTDHDTTAGLAVAKKTAVDLNINFIPGIEISTTWNNKCFHVLGLNIDPDHLALVNGIQDLRLTRIERAEKIAHKLAKKGINNAYLSILETSGESMITRTHFAEFLLTHNYVSTMQEAFDRYLGLGKPAFVATVWAELEEAVNWITGSGGIAVLAHPLRYKITASWMRRFLSAFKEAGGQGIEVVCGRSNADDIRLSINYAKRFELAGSVGSDFHHPDNPWVELGRLAPLPKEITPVWELFGHNTK
jgi:3',5'-nucleoside bisphosphate phosphatase